MHLSAYDRVIVSPRSLGVRWQGYDRVEFPDRFFTSVDAYSKLLLTREFYERFRRYDFVLVYQLDCLVFSRALHEWTARGEDYIGAPWFKTEKTEDGFSRVGNGGLSLRRVDKCLRVLEPTMGLRRGIPRPRQLLRGPLPDLIDLPWPRRWLKSLLVVHQVRKGVERYTAEYTLNEDRFWSDRAVLFDPSFRVAPVEMGLAFSFERFPEYCYEANGRQLPFGCHGWAKHGREFWLKQLGE